MIAIKKENRHEVMFLAAVITCVSCPPTNTFAAVA